MAIKPINNIIFEQKLSKSIPHEDNTAPLGITDKEIYSPSFLGQSKVLIDQIESLKNELLAFPKDIEYRKNLMLHAGKNFEDYYKIRSIIGSDEIKSIMKEFNESEDFYSVGKNDINIKKGIIRANLHIHTKASDGKLSIQELLDKAAEYADMVAKKGTKKSPFTIAITDHDTTESAKEAINIISENPLKYKNLRVILGAEITTYNDIAVNIAKEPTNTHILVYGIDPNEALFSNFIETTKQEKGKIAEKIINTANSVYKGFYEKTNNFFSIQEVKNYFNPVKKNILGIYNYVERYLETKLVLSEIILKKSGITKKLKQKGLPQDVDGLLEEIKVFYHPIDGNNKPRTAIKSIPDFLFEKLEIPREKTRTIIEEGLKEEQISIFWEKLRENIDQYKRSFNPKYNYMPTIESLYEVVFTQPDSIIGLAHPIETASKVKLEYQQTFLTELYTKFKDVCQDRACFSEIYYQSYSKDLQIIQKMPKIKSLLNKLSSSFELFKTGSADTHRTNIFKR